MAEITDYIRPVMFNHIDGATIAILGFVRKPQIVSEIAGAAQLSISHYDPDFSTNLDGFADSLFHDLLDAEVIIKEGDYFAGEFYKLVQKRYIAYRNEALENSETHKMAARIGSSFYPAVFNNFRNTNVDPETAPNFGVSIPASNRVVTLGHNAIGDLEAASTDLIELVAEETAIDGETNLRDQFVGQLKAGRELIREKSFSAYLLHQTVMSLLGRLIKKYKGQAIGEAARVLFALLVEHVFIG